MPTVFSRRCRHDSDIGNPVAVCDSEASPHMGDRDHIPAEPGRETAWNGKDPPGRDRILAGGKTTQGSPIARSPGQYGYGEMAQIRWRTSAATA
jgi:hypothetical protein